MSATLSTAIPHSTGVVASMGRSYKGASVFLASRLPAYNAASSNVSPPQNVE